MGALLIEVNPVAGLEAVPLPFEVGTAIVLMQEVVVPVGSKVPRTGFHAPPLLFLLLVMGYLLRLASYR